MDVLGALPTITRAHTVMMVYAMKLHTAILVQTALIAARATAPTRPTQMHKQKQCEAAGCLIPALRATTLANSQMKGFATSLNSAVLARIARIVAPAVRCRNRTRLRVGVRLKQNIPLQAGGGSAFQKHLAQQLHGHQQVLQQYLWK